MQLGKFDQKQFESLLHHGGAFEGTVQFSAPLAQLTYYQIGGPADVVVTPKTIDDLFSVHRVIQELGLPFFVLGWGSNVLISDQGIRGVVIRMKHLNTQVVEVESGILEVGASVGGSSLLRIAQKKGYGGLSHLTGIPGSVGGMAVMNAGTHLGEWKDCALEVQTVDLAAVDFSLDTRLVQADDYSYRRNHFLKPSQIIVSTRVRVTPEDPVKVASEIDTLYRRRKETQPVDQPSCGSVFMNPKAHGLHAWQVIEKLGLKGHRIGNAQFSEKHSNFIVNLGGAHASDVSALIFLAQSKAYQELGIELTPEVKQIG